MLRGWHVEGLAVRPEHRMVGHTGFLVTAGGWPRGGRAAAAATAGEGRAGRQARRQQGSQMPSTER